MTTELKIEGMNCNHCVQSVRTALDAIPGVETATVDLPNGAATVVHDANVTRKQLVEAIEGEGYRVQGS